MCRVYFKDGKASAERKRVGGGLDRFVRSNNEIIRFRVSEWVWTWRSGRVVRRTNKRYSFRKTEIKLLRNRFVPGTGDRLTLSPSTSTREYVSSLFDQAAYVVRK